MRWMKLEKPTPTNGDLRTVRRFLWWPKTLGQETRWLEVATIQQVWSGSYSCGNRFKFDDWFDSAWHGEEPTALERLREMESRPSVRATFKAIQESDQFTAEKAHAAFGSIARPSTPNAESTSNPSRFIQKLQKGEES